MGARNFFLISSGAEEFMMLPPYREVSTEKAMPKAASTFEISSTARM